ncbi:tripartite tricarboxylate transporter TctB family protein [Brevibacterium sp.]|uniref:tripartite tricarboxylate transporter TctB family protein n=1 Tax=Brevibacterium sp. TaxID=1701 RepID=UPI00281254D7|nr:tripartite tricarboxylate transporter TctB family protein [Brevibacterium sp.]
MARSLTAAHRRDLITGSAIVVIGVVYFIATFSIQRTNDIVTPATFPAIVGVALIVLGAVLVAQSLLARSTPAEAAPGLPATDVTAASETSGSTTSAGITDDGTTSAGESVDGASSAGETGVIIAAPPEPKSKQVALQFALFFVYLAILIPVGFLLSTAAFLMGLTSIYAPDRWIRNLVFSVVFAVVVYVAFVYGLAVYLPAGILG